jgi:hypothetical protein
MTLENWESSIDQIPPLPDPNWKTPCNRQGGGSCEDSQPQCFCDFELRATDPNLTVDDAFSLAIEMENSEINAIYGRPTRALHSSKYLLKRKIATFLPNHLDHVIEEARKFGVSGTILKEAKRPKKTLA